MAKEKDKVECRLAPINRAYLRELAKLGAYGRGESGVMRRFIEDGIREALEKGIIEKKSIEDFAEPKPQKEADAADSEEDD
jgi:hypothetical protein